MITDAQIQEAALAGLRDQLRIVLSRGECGAGKRLEELVTQTIEANQPAIESQVEKALMDALQSPEFVAVLRAEMLQAMTRKFAGRTSRRPEPCSSGSRRFHWKKGWFTPSTIFEARFRASW